MYENAITLYVDDLPVDTGTVLAVNPNRNDVQLGNDAVPPLGTRPFKGAIWDVFFHNVALQKEELAGSWPPVPPN